MSSPYEINVTNASAVNLMKKEIPQEGLKVYAMAERDAEYIEDDGDYQLLSGVFTTLMDETLLLRIIYCVHIVNTTSRNCHSDFSPESLSDKLQIGLNIARDTRKTTQQGI